MKPDWKDAPEWAQWLAIDSDGLWLWFESEPRPDDAVWQSERGRYAIAPRIRKWRETLESRPEAS